MEDHPEAELPAEILVDDEDIIRVVLVRKHLETYPMNLNRTGSLTLVFALSVVSTRSQLGAPNFPRPCNHVAGSHRRDGGPYECSRTCREGEVTSGVWVVLHPKRGVY